MKDRRMPGFAWRAIGMTQDYLDYCIQVYERHTHGYAAGKTMLSKANWPAKTFGFWSRNFLPLDVPYAAVLKHLIAQDQFCISSSFITNGNGIMAHRARAFWGIVMDTQRCTSEGIMRTMTDYYDQYEREKLRAAMWEESSSDDEDCPDEDFRNPFARGDAFVPMKAAFKPKKRKLVPPPLEVLNYDDLTYDELRELAAESRKDGLGDDPTCDPTIPNDRDRDRNPTFWHDRTGDKRHAADLQDNDDYVAGTPQSSPIRSPWSQYTPSPGASPSRRPSTPLQRFATSPPSAAPSPARRSIMDSQDTPSPPPLQHHGASAGSPSRKRSRGRPSKLRSSKTRRLDYNESPILTELDDFERRLAALRRNPDVLPSPPTDPLPRVSRSSKLNDIT